MSLALAPKTYSRDHGLTAPVVAEVISIVAAEFDLTETEMLYPTRDHRVWKPRMAAMYYCRLLTPCSLPELGRVFGDRSHTTVLRAFRRCRELIDKDPNWANRMDQLMTQLVERDVTFKDCNSNLQEK